MACKYIYEGVTYNSKEEFISKVIPTLQYKTLSNPVSKTFNLKQIEQDFDNYNEHPDVDYYLKSNIGKITDSTLTNLCDVTANICITYLHNKGINVLQKAFHIYPTLKIANFEDDFVNHKVAISYINNKMYIFDMPQNEYITLNKEGNAVFGEFKPRFIEVTSENMKKYYGINKESYNNTFYGNTASRYIGNAQTQVLYKNKEYINFQGNINDYFKQGSPTWSESDFKRKFFNKEDINPTFTYNQPQDYTGNSFLHLLSRDNNWVTFFVKSIIQDSAKKGYEKVLFPLGDTASRIEGHTTLEEFKKQKEDRIKELEKQKAEGYSEIVEDDLSHLPDPDLEGLVPSKTTNIDNEINQLKQELERIEKEGFAALRPIYKFYEETIGNILKKQGFNPIEIEDEYKNGWYEVVIPSTNPANSFITTTINPSNRPDITIEDKNQC